jgi:hypothetical protein
MTDQMTYKQCRELYDGLRQSISSLQWLQVINLQSFGSELKQSLVSPLNTILAEYEKTHIMLQEIVRNCQHRWQVIRREDGESHIRCSICQENDFIPSRDCHYPSAQY